MDTQKVYITFGKEYELGAYLGFRGDKKLNDGSGPSEISIGPFTSFREALITEKLLYDVYGESLYNYYVDEDNEQKGCHFHVKLNNVSYEEFWKFYVLYSTFSYVYRKFFTFGDSFRNTVEEWAEYITYFIYPEQLENYRGREYRAYTPNRNRKTVLTVEARLSEGSITLDIVNLLLSLPFYLEFRNLNEEILKKQLYLLSNTKTLIDDEDLSYSTYLHQEFYNEIKDKLQKLIKEVRVVEEDEEENENREENIKLMIEFKDLKDIIDYFINYYKNNKDKLIELLNDNNYNTSLEILELVKLYAVENRRREWLALTILDKVFTTSKKIEIEEALNNISEVLFENTLSRLGFKLKLEK